MEYGRRETRGSSTGLSGVRGGKVTSKNSTTLSDEDFTEINIVKYLKGSNSKWAHSKSLGKRIQNNALIRGCNQNVLIYIS